MIYWNQWNVIEMIVQLEDQELEEGLEHQGRRIRKMTASQNANKGI